MKELWGKMKQEWQTDNFRRGKYFMCHPLSFFCHSLFSHLSLKGVSTIWVVRSLTLITEDAGNLVCAQKTAINPRSRKGKTDGVPSRSICYSGSTRWYCVSRPIAHEQEGVTTLPEPIIHRGLSWASLPKMLLCHANMHRQTHARTQERPHFEYNKMWQATSCNSLKCCKSWNITKTVL